MEICVSRENHARILQASDRDASPRHGDGDPSAAAEDALELSGYSARMVAADACSRDVDCCPGGRTASAAHSPMTVTTETHSAPRAVEACGLQAAFQ